MSDDLNTRATLLENDQHDLKQEVLTTASWKVSNGLEICGGVN